MNIVKWYKNRSFQFKLVIGYLVLALIPMLCVTWYSYGKTRNVLLTEAYQSAEQEAERIEKNFSTMVEPYETILDVLYVDQMLSGYLFQDYSNDSYEDMFYYIDKKLSEICLMNAGIYKICFYSNNETLPQDNYYFYSMQDLDRRECVLTFDAIGETVFCGTSGDGKAFHMNRLMNFYPQGGMKGVLSLQIENQQIQPLLETINSTDEIYLVDQKGYILAASEPEMAGLPIRTRMPEEDLEQKAQIEFERDGISKIGNIQSGVFGTKILVISDKETVLKDAKAVSRRMMFLILCSAAMVFLCIICYTRWISARVQKVVYAAKRMGQGEFDYSFVEDEVKKLYDEDKRATQIYVTFAGLAICISCLGLFGLSLYDIRQRYREIALRKVNGATGKQVALLLVRKYLYILGAAFAVAIPLAYYIIHDYTKDFTVKAPVGVDIFITGFILTLIISLGTLLWQVRRAVRINPALIMKSE